MRILAALGVAVLLAACADAPSREPFPPTAAEVLAPFRTYAHGPIPTTAANLPSYTEIRGREIQERIDLQFRTRGLELAPPEEADLLVTFGISGHRFRYTAGGYLVNRTVRDYTEGTLVISVFDQKKQELFWHGHGTKRVFSERETPLREVYAVVDGILDPFPN